MSTCIRAQIYYNRGELSIMNAVDWHEITKAKKLVRANDSSFCGNAIAEYRDNIVILEHAETFESILSQNL